MINWLKNRDWAEVFRKHIYGLFYFVFAYSMLITGAIVWYRVFRP